MIRLVKQLIKFIMVGSVAFVTDFGSYTALTRFFDLHNYYVWVSVGTSFLAMLVGYFLNHRFTFRQADKPSLFMAGRYFSVTTSGLIMQNTLLAVLVELGDWHDLAAKFMAVVVVGFGWNFMLSRVWVFTGPTQAEVAQQEDK